jgi:hypothetical protein
MGSAGPQKRDQLRASHGENCWWCLKPMDFSPKARATQVPTIEHLQPKALGGGNELDNLRLCHPGCNKQLADRTRAEKERLRERRIRRLERKAPVVPAPKETKAVEAIPIKAKPGVAQLSTAAKAKPVMATPAPSVSVEPISSHPVVPSPSTAAPAPDWQRVAMIATASATFFAGLCLGMLIG